MSEVAQGVPEDHEVGIEMKRKRRGNASEVGKEIVKGC